MFRGGVGLLIVLAGALWLWHLSASSLFADEALSWRDSAHSLSQLITGVKHAEVNPLGYFVFLHAWIKVAPSDSEFWLRVPSVIAGLGGRAITQSSLIELFECAERDELDQLNFLDLKWDVVKREIERGKQQRRAGPSAENILRDLHAIGAARA